MTSEFERLQALYDSASLSYRAAIWNRDRKEVALWKERMMWLDCRLSELTDQ